MRVERWIVVGCLATWGCGPNVEIADDADDGTGGGSDSDDTMAPTGEPGTPASSCEPVGPRVDAVNEAQAASTQAAYACMAYWDCVCDAFGPSPVSSCRHGANMTYEEQQQVAQAAGLIYDGDCLAQAVADFQALGCGPADPAVQYAIWGAGRCAIYHGDRDLGDACTYVGGGMSDCAQGLACWDGRCVDACAQEELGPRCGAPYNFACPPGTTCSGDECTPAPDSDAAPGVGEACPWEYECSDDAWCEIEGCNFEACAGTCRPRRSNEAQCDFDEQCISDLCVRGLCQPQPVTGEPCIQGRCADGRECLPDDTCGPPEGAICEPQRW